MCISHCIFILPSNLKYPGVFWCLAAFPALVGEGVAELQSLIWLFSKAPAASDRQQQPWSLGQFQGIYHPNAISLPSVFLHPLHFWLPNFRKAGIPLAVYSVLQKICQVFQLGSPASVLSSYLPRHHLQSLDFSVPCGWTLSFLGEVLEKCCTCVKLAI